MSTAAIFLLALDFFGTFLDGAFQLRNRLTQLLVDLLPRLRRGGLSLGGQGLLFLFQSLLELRQPFLGREVIDQLPHEAIEPGQFVHGLTLVVIRLKEMLVAVDDHAELCAPVADVIVADDLMAEEAERAAKGIADHGRADMADMHRLGHIGRGVVDHVGPLLLGWPDAQARIIDGGRKLPHKPIVFHTQVDETRAGHLRRLAQIGHVEPGNNLGGQFWGLLVQLPAQGHGEVRLVIAEAGVLRGGSFPATAQADR